MISKPNILFCDSGENSDRSKICEHVHLSLLKRGEAFQKLDQQNELKFSVLILITQEFRVG